MNLPADYPLIMTSFAQGWTWFLETENKNAVNSFDGIVRNRASIHVAGLVITVTTLEQRFNGLIGVRVTRSDIITPVVDRLMGHKPTRRRLRETKRHCAFKF